MNSEFHIVSCMKAAIQDLDLPDRHEDEIKNIIGLGLTEAVRTLYPKQANEDFANKLADAYRAYYFSEDAPQQLFPGAVETLENLMEKGFLMAIATGKSRKGLDLSLEDTGLAGMFQVSRCADETKSKPHPRMLNEIMTELECNSEETVMIGDTEYDMEMAYNAGTKAIAVSYGVHETQRLLKYNPAGCIDKITELSGLIGSFSDKSIR